MLKYFTPHTILAEAITSHPTLIQLLPRFNISLGFGNKSIGCICSESDVPVNLFLIVCNIYAFDSYRPSIEDIIATDSLQLISYLKKSHIHYFEKRIPHIEKHLTKITEQVNPKHGDILMKFFLQYKKEMREHFDYEECVIFPILNNLSKNITTEKDISGFKETHTNIEDTLDDLIQIVFKYLPGDIEHNNIIGMAFDILQLADDIKKHAMIEEDILVPFIDYLAGRDKA